VKDIVAIALTLIGFVTTLAGCEQGREEFIVLSSSGPVPGGGGGLTTLTLTVPAAGDRVAEDQPVEIRWTAPRVYEQVRVSVATDAGATYIELAGCPPRTGSSSGSPIPPSPRPESRSRPSAARW